jgi:hypothetical protein
MALTVDESRRSKRFSSLKVDKVVKDVDVTWSRMEMSDGRQEKR